jgi:hypothetical protein
MTTTCQVAPLGKTNYSTWIPEMRAYPVEQKIWFIVAGKDTRPSDAAQAVIWRDKAAATAGAIYRALEPGQRCCLQAYGRWTTLRNKLESTVIQQTKDKYMQCPNSPGEHSDSAD